MFDWFKKKKVIEETKNKAYVSPLYIKKNVTTGTDWYWLDLGDFTFAGGVENAKFTDDGRVYTIDMKLIEIIDDKEKEFLLARRLMSDKKDIKKKYGIEVEVISFPFGYMKDFMETCHFYKDFTDALSQKNCRHDFIHWDTFFKIKVTFPEMKKEYFEELKRKKNELCKERDREIEEFKERLFKI